MAENERKNEIIGANYAWNIRSPVKLCKPWLNLGATSGSGSLVSLAAVFSIVTQRLRDDTKNGCEGDYRIPGKVKIFMPPTQQYFQTLHRNDG